MYEVFVVKCPCERNVVPYYTVYSTSTLYYYWIDREYSSDSLEYRCTGTSTLYSSTVPVPVLVLRVLVGLEVESTAVRFSTL